MVKIVGFPFKHCSIRMEFLANGHGYCILKFSASHFQHIDVFVSKCPERFCQRLNLFFQVIILHKHCQFQSSRVGIIG